MTITEKLAKSFPDKEKILFADKEYLITDGVDEHGLKLYHDNLVGIFWTDGTLVKRTMFDRRAYTDDQDGFWKYIKLRIAIYREGE